MRENIIKHAVFIFIYCFSGVFAFGLTSDSGANNNNNESRTLDEVGDQFLAYAVQGNLKEIKCLIAENRNLDLNYQDDFGYTALMIASEVGYLDLVLFLLDQESLNPSLSNEWSNTALTSACRNKHESIAAALIRSEKVSFNKAEQDVVAIYSVLFKMDELAQILFLRFSKIGNLDRMKYLFEHRGGVLDLNAESQEGHTVLQLATMQEHQDIVEWLVSLEDINIHYLADDDCYNGGGFLPSFFDADTDMGGFLSF